MSILETIAKAKTYLEAQGRVSLRVLRREFALDDEALAELVEELVDVQHVAVCEGEVLAWTAEAPRAAPGTAKERAGSGPKLGLEAERRQLTVMFCDLVGSTDLSRRLDAEELRDVLRVYQDAVVRVLARYEGHIAQYLGDGLLVYMGYPQAHEDDAERAVRAALEAVEAVADTNPALRAQHGLELAIRIGIHSGPVVVGEMGSGERMETLAVGETANLAARLQGVAAPGRVVISADTLHLVRGIFVTRDLGRHELKGIAEAVAVHQVVQPSGVRSRLDLTSGRLTPFVGRQEEVDLLLARWEQVEEGEGQVALISGEAGVGKSRLVQVLRDQLAETPHTWLECRCSPYTQESALYPVIELVQQGLAFAEEDSPKDRLGKLERGLERAGFPLPDAVPLFAALLSLSLPDRYEPLRMGPELQRRKTLEVLLAWMVALGERQPVLFLYEDLHWCDPSTLELLSLIVEQVPTTRVLLLLVGRPEFRPPWPPRSHHTPIVLKRLSRREARAMVGGVVPGEALPDAVVEEIAARADGMPLFVEELTKTVLESELARDRDPQGARIDSVSELAIPSTLQDSLMARLDRLGSAKEVAQLAAVLGREFSHELLEAVSPAPELLAQTLPELEQTELLYRRGLPPRAVYSFKHALIRDTAYESMLKSVRGRLHGRVAETLERDFPRLAAREPQLVAHHYDRAGQAGQALPYYQRAGDEARRRYANVEAIAMLERGVELVQRLPAGSEGRRRELELQLSLGSARTEAHGPASDDTGRSWERARVLCGEIGSPSQHAAALRGVASFHWTRSELDSAVAFAEQLLSLGRETGDEGHLLMGHTVRGIPRYFQGRFRGSLEDFDAALRLYDPKRHAALMDYGNDQKVGPYGFSSWSLWALGYPERSRARAEAMIRHARALHHPYSLAYALVLASYSYLLQREWESCIRHAEEAVELSELHGFPLWLSLSTIYGAAATACGRGEDTLADATKALAGLQSTGQQAGAPSLLWCLARIHQKAGREAEALGLVEAGLATSARGKQHFLDAELLGLKGELALDRDEGEAEALFRHALQVARRQEARSFELRAATSLTHLWQRQGRSSDARELLQPVYVGFTEGFPTQDLKDARELLESLA